MPRLGELLIAAGELTAHDVEQALRAQVLWGGRIGTNLIELGYIDLDKLATALGRQHRLPAALGRHFDRADAAVQARLSPDLAERFSCVPLLFAGPQRAQLIVAAIAPLDARALAMIAEDLGIAPDAIVQSVAGELRIRYHLERVYKIPRATRFLRSRGKTIPPFPQFEIDPLAFEDSQVDVPVTPAPPAAPVVETADDPPSADTDLAIAQARDELRVRLETKTAGAQARAAEAMAIDPPRPAGELLFAPEDLQAFEALGLLDADSLAIPQAVDPEASSGRERRRYVRTLDAPPSTDSERERQSLGRIAIKRLHMQAVDVEEAPVTMGSTLGEATRAIRRSQDRDRVAELVGETLFRFMLSCHAAVTLVIRGDAAMSWKGFSRAGAALPEIAVPLDQPGLIPRVLERCQTCRLPSTDLGPIDQLLLVSLGAQTGDLVVVPISIANQVMAVIAMATEPDASPATAESAAAAAGAAFARLMRNASR